MLVRDIWSLHCRNIEQSQLARCCALLKLVSRQEGGVKSPVVTGLAIPTRMSNCLL